MRARLRELALGISEIDGAGIALVGEAGGGQRRVHLRSRALAAAEPPPDLPQPRAALGDGLDVLLDRHVGEELEVLERAADAQTRDLPVRQPEDGFAEPRHFAAIRHQMPGHQVEQRGLAGAVRPDQRGDDAGAQRERDIVDRLQAAEGLGDARRLQQDLAALAHGVAALAGLGLLLEAPQAARAVDHQQHHGQAVGDLLDRADLGGRQIGQVAQAGRQQQDEDGADHRAEQRAVPPMMTIAISWMDVSSTKLSTLMKLRVEGVERARDRRQRRGQHDRRAS